MTVLLGAEYISRSPYFKVTHCNAEAGAELRILAYCGKSALRLG